jgi:crotonobetainyl-CoA:carnitine CoA-transferase CaiB-like acyl-CoA transferase
MGGLMSITGLPDGAEGAGPVKVGVALTDILTGLYATVGILSALSHRDRSGEGQHVDVSLLDVQVAALANQAMNYLASGNQPPRLGNAHPNIVPYQDFATSDGHLIVTVGNDGQFSRFCKTLGHPEWAEDLRFATNTARLEFRNELIPMIAARMRKLESAHWLSALEACNVPCGPINEMADVFTNPQVLHRGMKVQIPGTANEKTVMLGNPLHLSATPVEYRTAPPVLGADTLQVLSSLLGIDHNRISELQSRKVIAIHHQQGEKS